MTVQVIILAAGLGKRMHSAKPKVLHSLAGKPLLQHVINTALTISPSSKPIVIYGHQGKLLQSTLQHYDLNWCEQEKQLGTAHAVQQALPMLNENDSVLILYGDVPLVSAKTLQELLTHTPADAIGMIVAQLDDPSGYGRIKRDASGEVVGIIEDKDANGAERNICEINSGIYLIPARYLHQWLPNLKNNNAQGEYYLTDIILLAKAHNVRVHTIQATNHQEVLGVNDKVQLAQLERYYQLQKAHELMHQGVTIIDPHRLDIRGEIQIGRDVVLDANVILEGAVTIGDGCIIGPNVVLRDVELHNNVQVKANSVIEEAEIADNCLIGPFARIRPGSVLSQEVHIGNFVEVKNSEIGFQSKVNHLSYIGDSEVGKRVNIGAGTITCNYDGVNKHKTIIGDDVHIGSDTQLVAPVIVERGATIGAGATITKDVPAETLTITHKLEQRSIKGWKRPVKEKK